MSTSHQRRIHHDTTKKNVDKNFHFEIHKNSLIALIL